VQIKLKGPCWWLCVMKMKLFLKPITKLYLLFLTITTANKFILNYIILINLKSFEVLSFATEAKLGTADGMRQRVNFFYWTGM